MTETAKLEQELTEWAASQADRDNLVRAALAAGVQKQRIHDLTGIARSTIDRIAGRRAVVTNPPRHCCDSVTGGGHRADCPLDELGRATS